VVTDYVQNLKLELPLHEVLRAPGGMLVQENERLAAMF